MARKSKLTDKQWLEIERRALDGEAIRSLAKEFGIAESALRKRGISARALEIKAVAHQIVETEQRLAALPLGSQISAQSLAAKLRAISDNIASAAHYSAMTSHRLAGLAHQQVEMVDDASPMSSEAIKSVAGLTALANEASKIPLNLLAANKEAAKEFEEAERGYVVTPDKAVSMQAWQEQVSCEKAAE